MCEQDGEVSLTGADGHLRAASCCEVMKDDCQLAATRELRTQREIRHLIRLLDSQNVTSITSVLKRHPVCMCEAKYQFLMFLISILATNKLL